MRPKIIVPNFATRNLKQQEMLTLNTATQAQGARRVQTKEDVIYEKMQMDVASINFTHGCDGITFSVSLSGNPRTPFTVDITCGEAEYSTSFATYHEFQSLVNIGLGYFLGVFEDMNGTLPEDMRGKE